MALANGVTPPVRAPGGRNDFKEVAARVAYARGRNAVGTTTSKATMTAAGPVRELQPDPVLAARAVTHLQPSSMPVTYKTFPPPPKEESCAGQRIEHDLESAALAATMTQAAWP